MVPPAVTPKQNLGFVSINRTFRMLKEYAVTSFGTAALICLPLAFLGVVTALLPGVASTTIQFLVASLIGVWLTYAITVGVGIFSQGEDPGVGGLVRRSLSVGLVRFGFTSLLFNLVLGLIVIVAFIPFFMSLASADLDRLLRFDLADGDIFRILMGFLLSLPIVILGLLFAYLKLGLATAASALEGTGPGASLGRSWTITRGHMWEFFVMTFITGLITVALSFFLSGPAAMVSFQPEVPVGSEFSADFFEEQMFGRELGPVEAVVTGISAYLTTVLLTPLGAAMVANFFLLVRDPALRLDSLQGRMVPLQQPEASPAPPDVAPPVPQPPADGPEESPGSPPPS
jgi:hypothetical protein